MINYEEKYGFSYDQVIEDAKKRFWQEHRLDELLAYPVECKDKSEKNRAEYVLDIVSKYLEPTFTQPLENGVLGIDNNLWFNGLLTSGRIVEELMLDCHIFDGLNNLVRSRVYNNRKTKRIQFNKKSRRHFFSSGHTRVNLRAKSCQSFFLSKSL